MIKYNEFKLDNGLRVIHHLDTTKNTAVLNLLYNVGARDESPARTGFAHLFEHLMFEGSENIKSFDTELQKAGGVNNAFTSNDITNYYIEIPVENIETALWLESDRMKKLAFSEESLKVQKGVVIEEFKQRYLNQPFGRAHLHLRKLAYNIHPYQWATIGKNIEQIETATLNEVISFFEKFYHPKNGILCIAGNITLDKTIELVNKWFGDLEARKANKNIYEEEPAQIEQRNFFAEQENPQKSIYLAFHKPQKNDPSNYAGDLLASLIGSGKDSMLYKELVINKSIFNQISCYNGDELDPGLFHISGILQKDIDTQTAKKEIFNTLTDPNNKKYLTSDKLKGKINKLITAKAYQESNLLNRAMSLCFAKNRGDIDIVNNEINCYKKVEINDVIIFMNKHLTKENSNAIHYDSITK